MASPERDHRPHWADTLVNAGAPWAIEWCVGGRDRHTHLRGNAWANIQPELIDRDARQRAATKAARTGRSKIVMFLWSGPTNRTGSWSWSSKANSILGDEIHGRGKLRTL
jgi:hypothetical protein